MDFYIIINNEKKGPFSMEDLPKQNITSDTLVWTSGMPSWKPAKEVPELAQILTNIPPEIPQAATAEKTETSAIYPPKTWLVESILATLFCCLPFGIVGIIQASKVENLFLNKQYEAAQRASDSAKKWVLWSVISVVVIIVIYILVLVCSIALGCNM